MFVLGVSSGERCGKSSSCCIGRGVCELSVLRVVARFDPFLDYLVGQDLEIDSGTTYQLINVPASILASLGRVG